MNLQGLIFAPHIPWKIAASWYWFWPHLAAVLKDHEVLFFHIVMVSYLQWIAMFTWFKFCSNWTLMSVSLTAVRSHFVCVCCTITCLSSSANCPIYCNLLINRTSEISSSNCYQMMMHTWAEEREGGLWMIGMVGMEIPYYGTMLKSVTTATSQARHTHW